MTWFIRYSTSLASDDATVSDIVIFNDSAMSYQNKYHINKIRVTSINGVFWMLYLDRVDFVDSRLRALSWTRLWFDCVSLHMG